MNLILGVDIGGSHISSALVNANDMCVIEESFCKEQIDGSAQARLIIDQWVKALRTSLSRVSGYHLDGVGIAMPGPFNYRNGISLIEGVNKYQSLYGINVKRAIINQLDLPSTATIVFQNDAACFGLGESLTFEAANFTKVIAVTLGTGFGATFIHNGKLIKKGKGIPPEGELYNSPYKHGIAEDYISSRWLLKTYNECSEKEAKEVKEIAERAGDGKDKHAIQIFEEFGCHLAYCLLPWIRSFNAECLVIGGSISKAAALFLPTLQQELEKNGVSLHIKISKKMELSAIAGAATLLRQKDNNENLEKSSAWRNSSQALMPKQINSSAKAIGYNVYPFRSLNNGNIFAGYDTLATWMVSQKVVIVDGFVGNDWNMIGEKLSRCFAKNNIRALWFETSAFIKKENEIEELVRPFLGEKDDVWGKRTDLSLEDFYQKGKLESIYPDSGYDVNIMIGAGAALCKWQAPVVYIDLPKNELQYRMRAGSITNVGKKSITDSFASMYKQFYFVDWVVLNKHRNDIKEKIAVVADGQWRDDINWAFATSIYEGLDAAAHNVIRVRPWFEAGAWGGQWMKSNIPDLNQDEINYAWSFELITPENGLVFESDGNLLEVSFDWLMEAESKAVLGEDSVRFGVEFPIRFDFLDTFDGGNLSIQCHPKLAYIQKEFSENITQDETYYILDCKQGAGVYLGFQKDINPTEFRSKLEQSNAESVPVEIEKFVQFFPANKHDLFLIPNGTVHSAGANNLVLEISATPYIFTFKMYDWLRLDLDGKPRPINIDRAFDNLNFERKGKKVQEELVSHSAVLKKEDNYQIIHLPTHQDHFYDVHRIEFSDNINLATNNKCHVLMLVEGTAVIVKTELGETHRFSYAETFIIPAAAGSYQLINDGELNAKVIKAFIK